MSVPNCAIQRQWFSLSGADLTDVVASRDRYLADTEMAQAIVNE